MTNEMIGIVGAIGLTVFLFVLRHFILPSERGNKTHYVTPVAPRRHPELNKETVDDDAWLLRAPDIEAEGSVNRVQSDEPLSERRKKPRYDERHNERTFGGEIR